MGTVTVEQAVQSLYDQLIKTEYKASACWTTTKHFEPAYQKVNTDFVPDLLMNNSKKFIPTPTEQLGRPGETRTPNL